MEAAGAGTGSQQLAEGSAWGASCCWPKTSRVGVFTPQKWAGTSLWAGH